MRYKIKEIIVILVGILFLIPLIVTITNSTMTPEEISMNQNALHIIPRKISFRQYYLLLFEHIEYLNMFWKSVLLTLIIVIINSLYSIIVGCIIGKGKFKGRSLLIVLYTLAFIIPYQINMLPHYMIFRALKILESNIALVTTMSFNPFGVILISFLVQIVPNELIEYTKLETNSWFQIFINAIFPSIKGIFIILIIFIFCEVWNMVEQPLAIYSNIYRQPLSVLLGYMQQDNEIILPASTIYMFPVIIIYFFFHESLEETLKQLKG